MSEDPTTQQPDKLDQLISLVQSVVVRLDSMDARLDSMQAQINSMQARLDSMDARLDSMDARLDSMQVQINSMNVRLESVESTVALLDEKLKPTSKLDKIYAELQDLAHKFDSFMKRDFRELQRRQIYSEEQMVNIEVKIDDLKGVVDNLRVRVERIEEVV